MFGFVARQPIFDSRGSLFAYELLFRPGIENTFGDHDHDEASASVIQSTLSGVGLEALTGRHRAFINVTRQILLDGLFYGLPAARTVVELLETVEADEAVLTACAKLKEAGYLLALDDFVLRPALEPLLKFADFIKVDFLATTASERRTWLHRLKPFSVRLLAEKIETRALFERALSEGFTYFQGYYFQRPEMFAPAVIPPFKLNALRIIRDLNETRFDMDRIEDIVRQEGDLAQRLLEDLNAGQAPGRAPIRRVSQARDLLGDVAFRRWGSLVALASLGDDRPPEFVATCLVRARFCELLAQKVGHANAGSLFLIGLLSAVDALVGRPLSEILVEMKLAPEVEDALLLKPGLAGDVLHLVTTYERGDWAEVSRCTKEMGVQEDRVPAMFRQAVEWTNRMWRA
jgi:EAL and modified HD-GYP domain-containing signal transduction protein